MSIPDDLRDSDSSHPCPRSIVTAVQLQRGAAGPLAYRPPHNTLEGSHDINAALLLLHRLGGWAGFTVGLHGFFFFDDNVFPEQIKNHVEFL